MKTKSKFLTTVFATLICVAFVFALAACNNNGGDETPAAGTPTAPQSVTVTAGNGTITLSWTAPSSDGGSAITGYQVTRNNWIAKEDKTTSELTHTYTGLTNGVEYTIKVRAVNANGAGAEVAKTATPTVGGGNIDNNQIPPYIANIPADTTALVTQLTTNGFTITDNLTGSDLQAGFTGYITAEKSENDVLYEVTAAYFENTTAAQSFFHSFYDNIADIARQIPGAVVTATEISFSDGEDSCYLKIDGNKVIIQTSSEDENSGGNTDPVTGYTGFTLPTNLKVTYTLPSSNKTTTVIKIGNDYYYESTSAYSDTIAFLKYNAGTQRWTYFENEDDEWEEIQTGITSNGLGYYISEFYLYLASNAEFITESTIAKTGAETLAGRTCDVYHDNAFGDTFWVEQATGLVLKHSFDNGNVQVTTTFFDTTVTNFGGISLP